MSPDPIAGEALRESENPGAPGNPSPDDREGSLSGLTENLGLDPATPNHDPLIGTTIGGVRIIRSIAEGGMGRVYEGLQEKPRRPVAVKVLRPGLISREICRRFDNESELLGRLRHPHIAQIYSAGVCEVVGAHVPYFVMEFIPDAKPITEYVIDKKLETQQKLELFRKVCEAVAHGHEKGVIHRDLKPSNILVEPSGDPKVIDFGVARSVDTSSDQMTALTEIGQLVGTVQYMSPEQFSADPTEIDTRADVYALGVILYELLTGKPPYEIRREQIFAAAEVVRKQKPVSPSKLNRTVQPDVEKITGRCLQKDRTFRYANAAELKNALADYLGGKPVRDQNPGWRGSLISRARDWAKSTPLRMALGLLFAGLVAMPFAWLLWANFSAPQSLTNSIGIKLNLIPAGTFTMGQAWGDSNETLHQVTLTKPFFIGVYEVTNAQWKRVMGEVLSKWKDDDRPVEQVSWEDAVEFCQKLSALPEEREAGRVYRLPTEAEWEYACRAGTDTKYSFGDDESRLGEYGWYGGNAGYQTLPVGQKKANGWGLFDMHGNVWEWCHDWYGTYYKGAVTDPQGPSVGSGRVYRGGSWDGNTKHCRSARRDGHHPSGRRSSMGFRIAMSLESSEAPDLAATPLRVAVNGLGGKDYVDPETFGPNWLGFNPKCSGEEKAWIEKESFAVIATKGAIAWPSVPASRYVCDFEITFNGDERDLKICFGDPYDGDQIFFDYVAERQAVECSLRLWRHGSWGWYGHRDFEVNKRHVFRLVVGDGRQNLFAGGSLVLAEHNSWPTDCRLRIWSGTASGTIIHSLSFRPLTPADVEACGWEMPPVTVGGQPAIAARRIAQLTDGLSDKPTIGKRCKSALVGSPLAWIEPGTFQMGSSRPDDVRRQTVVLTKGFWIGQTEVTQREYRQVMGSNPSRIGGSEYLPVDWVAWEDCEAFCRELNDAARKAGTLPAGYEYRLPTEAEWEYACRAGSDEDYSAPPASIWDRDRSGRCPREVADSEPNDWGLYDMHGNAMEWCRDRWYEYLGRAVSSEEDPYHPGKPLSESFVVRGGSWWLAADTCSSHWRSLCTNTPAGGYRGFRIALAPIQEVLIDKTLVAWTTLESLEQRGGGVLSIEDPRNEFDAIVFGEQVPFRWTIGSHWGERGCPTPERAPLEDTKHSQLVQIAIVYSGPSIALYRNGVESVWYEPKGPPVPYRVADAKVLLGTRHVPIPENGLFAGELDDARIYDVALTAEEIRALVPNKVTGRMPLAWWHFEDGTVADATGTFSNTQTFGSARVRGGRLVLDGREGFVVCRCKTSPTSDELVEKQLVVDFLAPGARPGINGIPAEGKPLDLLKIADPPRDSVWGTWKRVGEELESGTEHNARIRFPVRPPREYEYHIEFTRLAGEERVAQCCTGQGAGFDFVFGANRNTIAGVERLDWRDVASSSSRQRRDAWITNGKRHTSTIRVRRDYLEVLFDGQTIISMPMDYSRVSQHTDWAIPDAMLGLGSWNSAIRFHRATVTDIGPVTE